MSFITSQGLPTPVNIGDALISDGTNFVSSQFLNPIDQTPANNATGQSLTPTLTISSFAALWGRTQTATQWQVATDSAFASLVVNTGDDAVNLTSYTIPTALSFTTRYYWRARFKNSAGIYSPWSVPFSFVTFTPIIGQQEWTTPGTYTWVAPASGIGTVSIVAVGGGSGSGNYGYGKAGAGGGLAYKNNRAVTAGSSYTVVVGGGGASRSGFGGNYGGDGGTSSFQLSGTKLCSATHGRGGSDPYGGYVEVGDGGGTGGLGKDTNNAGGAGGYAGTGGQYGNAASTGSGGGGSGVAPDDFTCGSGGGGVGIYGQTTDGTAGSGNSGGGGGSGGAAGGTRAETTCGNGGLYGGGGGVPGGLGGSGGSGGSGAVRIIYPGATRYFPATQTGNL